MTTRQLAKRHKNPARRSPSMSEKLACALLEIMRLRGMPIERDVAKAMSSDQIASLFQFDHDAGFVAHGADNHPAGMSPLLIAEHRHKTAKIDQPAIAKGKRLSKAQEELRAILLAKSGQGEEPEAVKRKSSFACGRDSQFKKKLSGETVRR